MTIQNTTQCTLTNTTTKKVVELTEEQLKGALGVAFYRLAPGNLTTTTAQEDVELILAKVNPGGTLPIIASVTTSGGTATFSIGADLVAAIKAVQAWRKGHKYTPASGATGKAASGTDKTTPIIDWGK